jgi:hypothetical protein
MECRYIRLPTQHVSHEAATAPSRRLPNLPLTTFRHIPFSRYLTETSLPVLSTCDVYPPPITHNLVKRQNEREGESTWYTHPPKNAGDPTEREKAWARYHRSHGPLTGDATTPEWNGYLITVTCPCGVVFERWVTPEEADADLIRWASLN